MVKQTTRLITTMSRSNKKIDWSMVDELLQAHCLGTEIASSFDMHPNTFYRRVEEKFGISFTEYSTEKKKKGKNSLRLSQLRKALEGNTTMQIWLGKNWLGQKDDPREEKEFDGNLSVLLDLLQSIKKPEEFKRTDRQEPLHDE